MPPDSPLDGVPPMEKPGFKDRGLPVQTVPMIPSMRASSAPIPITLSSNISIMFILYWKTRHTLVYSGNDLGEAGNTVARDVTMVGESVESRARTTLIVLTRGFEDVLAGDVDGLVYIDKKPSVFLQFFNRLNSYFQCLRGQTVKIVGAEGRKGIGKVGAQ
jgi:hypothetical protein